MMMSSTRFIILGTFTTLYVKDQIFVQKVAFAKRVLNL